MLPKNSTSIRRLRAHRRAEYERAIFALKLLKKKSQKN